MTDTVYTPKGGACSTCNNNKLKCSHLDFKSMPVIGKYDHYIIVACAYRNKPVKPVE